MMRSGAGPQHPKEGARGQELKTNGIKAKKKMRTKEKREIGKGQRKTRKDSARENGTGKTEEQRKQL